MAERITGHTELIGLMAYPIRHSSSPAMHNEAFATLGLDYAYLAFEVDNSTLEDAIKGLRALKMVGSNVSMPNKTVVGQYLDELSPAAEMCGAVNTIVNDNGKLIGHITDGIGFMQALKDNSALQFAVITGCLKIAKESVFSGTNNFVSDTITDSRLNEYFGFTQEDMAYILRDLDAQEYADKIKNWYDGYHFGDFDVYCPWDVINYVDHLQADPNARPQAYWINSSGNGLVRRLINIADESTKDEIERLIAGETIEKAIRLELTYDEIDNSIDNIWSVLFTTGYLTNAGEIELPGGDGYGYRLVIPNKEVRQVFVSQIQEWFRQTVTYDNGSVQDLCGAFMDGDTDKIQSNLNMILIKTISVLDTKARDDQKENFYHGLLLGLLRSKPDWRIKSNRESGDGFSDISIEPTIPEKGIVVEVKYSNTISGLDDACGKAMKQIRDRRYDEALREDGREDIIAYGIAFCRKRCKVVCEKM